MDTAEKHKTILRYANAILVFLLICTLLVSTMKRHHNPAPCWIEELDDDGNLSHTYSVDGAVTGKGVLILSHDNTIISINGPFRVTTANNAK